MTLAAYPPASAAYFARDAQQLARLLIGAYVVCGDGKATRVVRIVETEAYRGPRDAACHARFGLTKRTRALLGPPGRAYVFLVYGMHECFNVVGGAEGKGHAVLIRAGEPVLGLPEGMRGDGPGRLTRALGITRNDDGHDLTQPPLYVSPRQRRVAVTASARVGVAYAGADALQPWRFFDATSKHVSRPPASSIGLGPRGR